MKKITSYILWVLCLLLVVASICEMSYGYMDPESIFTYLTIQRINWEFYEYDWMLALFEIFMAMVLMIEAIKLNKAQSTKYFEIAFRIGLGLMFIFASWHKVAHPMEFANLIAQYQFLPSFLVNIFALVLAPAELILGILVIIGPYNKYNAKILLAMMLMFIVAIGQALIRDLGITCGCFALEGAQDKKGAYVTLIRDIILLGPIIWLYFHSKTKSWIWEILKK